MGEGGDVSVVGHPRAQRLSVDTPFGEGGNELAVPIVLEPREKVSQ